MQENSQQLTKTIFNYLSSYVSNQSPEPSKLNKTHLRKPSFYRMHSLDEAARSESNKVRGKQRKNTE